MKKRVTNFAFLLMLSCLMTSCYTLTYSVGEGSQLGIEVQQRNKYYLYGIIKGETSNPTKMAGGLANYDVTTQLTFKDGLIRIFTFGIFTPTTTVVKK